MPECDVAEVGSRGQAGAKNPYVFNDEEKPRVRFPLHMALRRQLRNFRCERRKRRRKTSFAIQLIS